MTDSIVWYVASRGRARHKDYRWVASVGANPETDLLRDSMEMATKDHLTGGDEVNAFLRREGDHCVLALWQLGNSAWPRDVERRQIMAHVIGVGREEDLPALEGLASAALQERPPVGLVTMADNEFGFEIGFDALETWRRAGTGGPALEELVRLRGGWFDRAGKAGFVLSVPRIEVESQSPKARSALSILVRSVILLVTLSVILVALLTR